MSDFFFVFVRTVFFSADLPIIMISSPPAALQFSTPWLDEWVEGIRNRQSDVACQLTLVVFLQELFLLASSSVAK